MAKTRRVTNNPRPYQTATDHSDGAAIADQALALRAFLALGAFDPGTNDEDDASEPDDGVDMSGGDRDPTTREEMLECCQLCGEIIPDHRARLTAARYCSTDCAKVGALIKAPSITDQCLAGRLPRTWITTTYRATGNIGESWNSQRVSREKSAAAGFTAEDLAGEIDPSEYETDDDGESFEDAAE